MRRPRNTATQTDSDQAVARIVWRGVHQPGFEVNRAKLRGTWNADGSYRQLSEHSGETWGSERDFQLCHLVTRRRRERLSPADIASRLDTSSGFGLLRSMFTAPTIEHWKSITDWEGWQYASGAMHDGATAAEEEVAMCGRHSGEWAGGWFVPSSRVTHGTETSVAPLQLGL